MGDRWSDDMVDELFHNAPIALGQFNYKDFIRTLKHGAAEQDEDTSGQGRSMAEAGVVAKSGFELKNKSDSSVVSV